MQIWPGFSTIARQRIFSRSVNPWVPPSSRTIFPPSRSRRAFSRDGKHSGHATRPFQFLGVSLALLQKGVRSTLAFRFFIIKSSCAGPIGWDRSRGSTMHRGLVRANIPKGARGRGAKRSRGLPCLVVGGCRCVNRAHTKRHTPRAIVRALSSEGCPFCPWTKGCPRAGRFKTEFFIRSTGKRPSYPFSVSPFRGLFTCM